MSWTSFLHLRLKFIVCTCFDFFFETSKNGTRRAYPPAATPPIKQVPFHPPNKLFWNLLLDLCIRAYVDVANPQLLIMVLCVVHDTCENREIHIIRYIFIILTFHPILE